MYEAFELVLMLNHACNLRCTYCYTGSKYWRSMPARVAFRSVDRAIATLQARGTLQLGFFGGEPLLEAELLLRIADYARCRVRESEVKLEMSVTTNGTLIEGNAWRALTLPEMQVTFSHDGLPIVHNTYRRSAQRTRAGRVTGNATQVIESIQLLSATGKDVSVSMVVRPDTVGRLPEGINWLRDHGVQHVDPTLDLWARWTEADTEALQASISRCADIWRDGLPGCGISWFDEKALKLTVSPTISSPRCAYGDGQVAVAPSGNLYPCERVIGADEHDNPARLPSHMFSSNTFGSTKVGGTMAKECSSCAIQQQCNTFCRCSNFIRTGNPTQPDGLLCLLDKACFRETSRILRSLRYARPPREEEVQSHG